MTLLELMAVVTIIGLFLALAGPSMSGILNDRHASRAADEIAQMFRVARSRAAATGAAHMVRAVSVSGTNTRFELLAAQTPVGAPVSSCLSLTWTTGDSRVMTKVDFSADTEYAGKLVVVSPLSDSDGTTPPTQDYCITPGGISWWRTTGTFFRPNGWATARYTVERKSGSTVFGIKRVVTFGSTAIPYVVAG